MSSLHLTSYDDTSFFLSVTVHLSTLANHNNFQQNLAFTNSATIFTEKELKKIICGSQKNIYACYTIMSTQL